MKLTNLLVILFSVILLNACTGRKQLIQLTTNAETAYKNGDYQNALAGWEQIIQYHKNKGEKVDGKIYASAGKSALRLAQYEKAINHFDQARYASYADAEMYADLAKYYRKIDNLSKEISALEVYNEKFKDGNEISAVRSRLFETYIESENWDKGLELWPLIEQNTDSNITLQQGYFILNRELGNNAVCDKLSDELLTKDSENTDALEWNAKKYYKLAEDRYQVEMETYNKNKTRSQYSKLVKALKIVSTDFRKSRDYFEKLYKITPTPEFARYLGNVYTRLNNKKKASYYKNLSKK